MLNKVSQILLKNRKINGYKIEEFKVESYELFFIKKSLEMDRVKNVHDITLTVYKDIEEIGNRYRGSSTIDIHPTMDDKEIEDAISDAIFAAQYVKNPYYPLVKPSSEYEKIDVSSFSKESLSYWMNEIVKTIYKNDIYENGGINSCEIFLNKVHTHIVNSEGIDIDSVHYDCMIEVITNWKEDGEEVEIYKRLNFSDFESEALSEEVKNMIIMCKERATAKRTPNLEKSSVLLTGDAVKRLIGIYYSRCNAEEIYNEISEVKIGDIVQGGDVKGDLITMKLDPLMKNSTCSGGFDEDGFPVKPVTIIENGVLKRYIANTRYAHYLGVEPTGYISNIVVCGGSRTISELKSEPYLEIEIFSDFTVDALVGSFSGEIRLARYFDGKSITPVTGGSISGNIENFEDELFLSKEIIKDNNYEGPSVIKLLNVSVNGIS